MAEPTARQNLPGDVVEVEVIGSELYGEGGFVQLRRSRVRNRRRDGSETPPYSLDMVERPGRVDALAVLAYEQGPRGPRVLLRLGLRPVARLGRAGQPTREGHEPEIHLVEVVAGILEAEDHGLPGLKERAVEELLEETGVSVAPAQIETGGPPVFISAGIMAERIYFCFVETPLDAAGLGAGDGSPLEEGSIGVVLPLAEALRRCREGEIQDAKTEVALRRLAESLEERAAIEARA